MHLTLIFLIFDEFDGRFLRDKGALPMLLSIELYRQGGGLIHISLTNSSEGEEDGRVYDQAVFGGINNIYSSCRIH